MLRGLRPIVIRMLPESTPMVSCMASKRGVILEAPVSDLGSPVNYLGASEKCFCNARGIVPGCLGSKSARLLGLWVRE